MLLNAFWEGEDLKRKVRGGASAEETEGEGGEGAGGLVEDGDEDEAPREMKGGREIEGRWGDWMVQIGKGAVGGAFDLAGWVSG